MTSGPVALERRFGSPTPWRWVVPGYGEDSGKVLSPQFADEAMAREFGRGKGWEVERTPQEIVA